MARQNWLIGISRFLSSAVIVACLAPFWAQAEEAFDNEENETARRLVADAREAEADGETDKCYRLLREAVRLAPDFGLARWQLGQMKVDGQWLTVEEAQRRAAADPQQAEYFKLRKQLGETPAGQLELARWCRKKGLDEEARFHWASVLAVDPGNEEALRAVDMRWSGGQLLTPEQIQQQKTAIRRFKQTVREWKPKVARWQRAVEGSDPAAREAALKEIRETKAVDVLSALEAVTLGRYASDEKKVAAATDISLALVDAMEKMPERAATVSLVRHSVLSPIPAVRTAATNKLKPRQLHEYVPLLLDGLAMPLESSFTVSTTADGSVHYRHSLYREGPDNDWSLDVSRAAVQRDFGSRHIAKDTYTGKVYEGRDAGAVVANAIRKANVASRYENRFANNAVATEAQVEHVNRTAGALNALIIAVLTEATGEKLGENPKSWWDWWRDQNEYYASNEKDVVRHYDSDIDTHYYGSTTYSTFSTAPPPPPPPPPPPGTRRRSCFAKGTLVWTKIGQRPIESLEIGDFVLSQNVVSGELAYKPVIARTVRPPSEIMAVKSGSDVIRATRGHPFWVAGVGWQMAKELEADAVLHGVTGSSRVVEIQPSDEEETYNLVVADFNTYFVGESGLLVHDNTPRMPTRTSLPGVAMK